MGHTLLLKNNFTQTKLNQNNFTSQVWWALIEEIEPRAKKMAGKKEMACLGEFSIVIFHWYIQEHGLRSDGCCFVYIW